MLYDMCVGKQEPRQTERMAAAAAAAAATQNDTKLYVV